MKILFITSTRLGDGVLSTGALSCLVEKYPAARITVACGPLVAGVFATAPNVERVIPLKKERYNRHWLRLWKETAATRWDIVVDLRDSLVSRLLLARKRYIWGKQDKRLHKVEQIAQVIGTATPPAPRLWFSAAQQSKAAGVIPSGRSVLAVGPAANWAAKTWPAESFIALLERLTAPGGILPDAMVAVFAAPGEEDVARKVLDAIPLARRIDMIAKGRPEDAAAAIARCTFYVGNDSGLMHAAAAAGVPTLGLFGPSWPHLYHPWGSHTAYAATPENFDQLIAYPGYNPRTAPCLMTSLTVEAAHKAAVKLWNGIKR